MSIYSRIRAHGGDVTRNEWRFKLQPGRLSKDAIAYVKTRKFTLYQEVWPDFDRWAERAAIMEYDGGLPRAEAEAAAYESVTSC